MAMAMAMLNIDAAHDAQRRNPQYRKRLLGQLSGWRP